MAVNFQSNFLNRSQLAGIQNQIKVQPQKLSLSNPGSIQSNSLVLPNAYPLHPGMISFSGNALNDAQLLKELNTLQTQKSQLLEKFTAGNETSILAFIENNKPSNPKEAVSFLFDITSDPQLARDFVQEVASDPTKTRANYKKLQNFVGGGKKGEQLFKLWLYDQKKGYHEAYNNYYDNNVWKPAKSLEDIIKFSPNIAPWAMDGKVMELGTQFTIGKVPEGFGGVEGYRELIEGIKDSEFFTSYKNAKDCEADPATRQRLAKENNLDPSETMKIVDIVNSILREQNGKPIEINGGFTATPFVQSYSAKLIFKIEDGKGNEFFLKMNPYRPDVNDNTDNARKLRENQDLRPDMPYLNALVDFYLKANDSENAPGIRFYDHGTDTVLYDAAKGKTPEAIVPEAALSNLYVLRHLDHVQNLQNIGIQINDAAAGNFIETPENHLSLIDSGHVYYSDPLRPMLPGKHIVLGSLCGKECREEV